MPHAGYGTAPVPFPPAAPPRAGRGCSAAPARSPAAGAAPRTPRARPASPTPHRPRLLQHCRTAPAPAPRGAGSAAPCSRSLPARTIEATVPPATPVPSERRAAEPAPVANTSGSTPIRNASEVITIGRSRR
ncbi:hypothetical protein G6F54_013693 [Rhizopus delemar]|nr:hypothetical protein G6F54_013693 [Rhizopus delemar]